MMNQTNYEEDLFLLKNLIRYWSEAVQIPADPEYFAEKLLEDLDFIEAILSRLQESLETNVKLIRRVEIIHDLLGTRTMMIKLLTYIMGSSTPLCAELQGHKSRLADMQASQKTLSDSLDRQLRLNLTEEEAEEDLITPVEMEFLLKREPSE